MLPDSGAKASLLNAATYYAFFGQQPLTASNKRLCGYQGHAIKALGQLELPVRLGGATVPQAVFHVVEKGANVLGVDVMGQLGIRLMTQDGQVLAVMEQQLQIPDWLPKRFQQLGGRLGHIKGFVHRPHVDGTVRPVRQPLRRIPISLQETVRKQVADMLAQDVIEPITASEWASNLVLVPKKNGQVRICTDLRGPNKAIVPDVFPLPTFEELSTEFQGSKCFSKLDLNSSYQQLELAEESRNLTAFMTHDGLYRYKRVCYGLSSAPAAFQKVLATIIGGIKGSVNYIDDLVIHGSDRKQHDERLMAVLGQLLCHNVTLNLEKCQWAQDEIQFLGYEVSAQGLKPLQSHVDAIDKIPSPHNVADLQAFLGTVKYFSQFVPHLADIAEPLFRLTRKNAIWNWSADCELAFKQLKGAVVSKPCLQFFNTRWPTFVCCDSSAEAIGACLLQEDNQGHRRPVAFCSRTLNETERKYSASEREALACIFACERWHYYLHGRKFELQTDHSALQTLLAQQGHGHRPLRLHRWADRLLAYDFTVKYVPGAKNIVPDFLSRHAVGDSDEGDMDDAAVNSVLMQEATRLISEEQLAKATAEDDILHRVLEFTVHGWPKVVDSEFKDFAAVRNEISAWSEGRCLARGARAVVPRSLQAKVLELAHFGHLGVSRTKQHCRQSVWWPGMDKCVEAFVRDCTACALSEKSFKAQRPLLTPTKWPTEPWSQLQMDIFGPLPPPVPYSQRFLLVVWDLHSKWPEVSIHSEVTAAVVLRTLSSLFARWGLPKQITTDGGPQFKATAFESFLGKFGIAHRTTPHYHPQGNSGVERFNRVLKESIKAHLQEGAVLGDAVQEILWSYRSTPHALTGQSPASLMLGRTISTPLTTLKPKEAKEHHPLEGRIQAQQKQQFGRLNRTRQQPALPAVGQWVRVRRPFAANKLASRVSMPKRVKKIISPTIVELDDSSRWHVSRCLLTSEAGENGSHAGLLPGTAAGTGGMETVTTETADSERNQHQLRRSTRRRCRPSWFGEVVSYA
jgi:transposase InsO family protein